MLSSLIEVKNPDEIEIMRQGAALTLEVISKVRDQIRVGMSTQDLDNLVKKYLLEVSCEPAFFGYQPTGAKTPYPSHACLCINEEVFHAPGNPSRRINKGDLVTIDLGLKHRGLYADCAETMLVGDSSAQKLALIRACADAIQAALPLCAPGGNVRNLTKIIDVTIRSAGFFPVMGFGGHGIGSSMHLSPHISNDKGHTLDCELPDNFILCLEPAATTAPCQVSILEDGWTVTAPTGILSAHVERMVLIRKEGGIILK